jgi:hypothetical protein
MANRLAETLYAVDTPKVQPRRPIIRSPLVASPPTVSGLHGTNGESLWN